MDQITRSLQDELLPCRNHDPARFDRGETAVNNPILIVDRAMENHRQRGLGAIVLFGLGFTSVVAVTFLPALLVTLLTVSNRLRNARTPLETSSFPPP